MKKVWLVGIVVAFVGFLAWQIPLHFENERKATELRQEQQKMAAEAEAAEIKRIALEKKNLKDERRAAASQASDESLKSLIRRCHQKIKDEIAAKGSKPAFAVHFPEYGVEDLKKLRAMGIAMNMSTGRPSVSLDKDDHQSRQIAELKQYFPDEISVVVESASDSFTGVKRWAAAYTCSLDGLTVTSASQDSGSMHFF